ncbi:uncharacterized protein TNCV_3506531 [Trichonephila clavipes]|uniref:Uncharacterized protein n=1 Tax=Trichonephila clavipes TaxID=2585209 RepID=A0A8X6S0Y3_TRICX|nr:uncharacterized protein TNCV_3506531 [Trichonephila clavipes]
MWYMNFNGFGATVIFSINVHHDAVFICYRQNPNNARSVALAQRAISPRLIEDETFNDRDIINNSIDYKDEREEPDSLRADKIYARIQFCNKLEKHFLKVDINFERSLKFQKELQSCISGYRNVYKQLAN